MQYFAAYKAKTYHKIYFDINIKLVFDQYHEDRFVVDLLRSATRDTTTTSSKHEAFNENTWHWNKYPPLPFHNFLVYSLHYHRLMYMTHTMGDFCTVFTLLNFNAFAVIEILYKMYIVIHSPSYAFRYLKVLIMVAFSKYTS